ncbi:MAG: hypothetical protein WCT19_00450 [Candidatus Paceibacterota bacterium]|jgi:hypothetical protein
MQNLLGNKECDEVIAQELTRCGISIVKGARNNGLVPFSLIGMLGDFTFRRECYYYEVVGNVSLEIAEELYADPIGKSDIVVAGQCDCPPPRELAEEIGGALFVTLYHIDTEAGLRLFVDTLKNHFKELQPTLENENVGVLA